MNGETRKAALGKLDAIKLLIGHPDELLDDEAINEPYKDLEINRGSFIDSYINVTTLSKIQYYGGLRKSPVDAMQTIFTISPMMVNAHSFNSDNSIGMNFYF